MLHVCNNVTLHLSILYYHTNTNITIILYYIIIASTAAKYTNNNHQQQSQSPAEAEVPVFIVHVLILKHMSTYTHCTQENIHLQRPCYIVLCK